MMQLAFRNLWRRKRRTFITAASIGFGLWLSVLTIGIRESTYQRFVRTGAQASFGYLTVGSAEFQPSRAQLSRLNPTQALLDSLRAQPGVRYVLPRRIGESVVQSTSRNTGAAWLAVDPSLETEATNLFCQHLLSGTCGPTWKSGAMIGQTLASNLGLKVDDQLIYTIQHADGQNISLMTVVRGIFNSGSEELDGHLFMLPLDELNQQLPESSRNASFLALFVDDSYEVQRLYPLLRAQMGDLKLMSWEETQPDLVSYFAADRLMYFAMLGFISLIIASGVATCINMNTIERRRELGTLLTLGMYPLQLLRLLLLEAFCLAGLGYGVGLVAVAPFYLYLSFVGFDMAPFVGESMNLGNVGQVDLVVRCTLRWQEALAITATLMATSLGAALIPALRAAYSLPVKILREG